MLTRSRLTCGGLTLALALLTSGCGATAPSLDGTWETTFTAAGQPCTLTSVYSPGKRWSETAQCGGMMTMASGTYEMADGVIARKVLEWEPRDRWVVDGRGGGHREPNAQPPGGSARVTFDTPDTLTWNDLLTGTTVVFRRR